VNLQVMELKIFDTHFLRLPEIQTRADTLAEIHEDFLLKLQFISLYLPLFICVLGSARTGLIFTRIQEGA